MCIRDRDERYRGLGIGKKLFRALLDYMEQQNISRFYLYTDNSCNYGFYEHQGMRRCGQKSYKVPLAVDNEMQFFLYEYDAVSYTHLDVYKRQDYERGGQRIVFTRKELKQACCCQA